MPPSPPRVAVLGCGPVGLEAALAADALGLPCTVYERGRVGEHLRRWGHVRLFSPFGMNSTALGRDRLREARADLPGDTDLLTGREHVAAYLEPLAALPGVHERLRPETEVLRVGRRGLLKGELFGDPKRAAQPFRLLLRTKSGEQVDEADVVLDCTGVYGQPCWLGEGGIPAVGETAARAHIVHGLEDVGGERRSRYADHTTLVIGGGLSAATTVCGLSALADRHPGTWVIWLTRQPRSQPLVRVANDPLRERDLLAVRANSLATRGDGNVEFRDRTVIGEVRAAGPDGPFVVAGQRAGQAVRWEVERLIANVGYSPDVELCRELHVSLCPATLAPAGVAEALRRGGPPAAWGAALRQPEPNFFVLGAKSYGRNGDFLLRSGFEQVRDVFELISGRKGPESSRRR